MKVNDLLFTVPQTQRDILRQITDLFYLLTVGVEGYCCTWSHKNTPQTVGLSGRGSTNRRESDNTHKTLTRDNHTPGGIRTRNPGNRAAALNFKELLSLNLLF